MYILENNQLRIQVASMGAELKSLYCKRKNKEHLWQGDPKWWGRSAPHLFPRIGFETNEYIKKNNIVKHGYARDTEFVLIEETATFLKFKMKEELTVTYELAENNLSISYEVTVDFPFMIGGHPAFNIDRLPTEIHFSSDSKYCLLRDGIIDPTITYPIEDKFLIVEEDTFYNDALIFMNFSKLNKIRLGNSIEISYDSEYLGI
ncbi:hypothetical protein [Halobacteriovorax sp. ZH1_bin.1]|uniref:aldose epimerase family protein n=1 Tax=Halobacteriovorax sp. ZH1_bin.1 TaxID=3157723 RepID=UPI00371D33D6